jgi:arylsulfatase A-like enzyme
MGPRVRSIFVQQFAGKARPMSAVCNILFIMADQLRADYLSCYGHPHIRTPTIDALAERGVRFTRAYVNATVCGPSRMSYYTGRYVTSHGSTWNTIPLRVGEPTMGDHLRKLGVRTALVGKTHMAADWEGLVSLGVPFGSVEGILAAQCGFEPFERDDGLHPSAPERLAYNRYLRAQGYEGSNPWQSIANSGKGKGKRPKSGWLMRNSQLAANVSDEHSETAYMTNRAMDFMREAKDAPWCLHLSYIKPHWPYIASAPYHDLYSADDVIPANRSLGEKKHPQPVYAAYMRHIESKTFSREKVRNAVIPVYMGLIRQIDDHLRRLFAFMKTEGLLDNTMIVLCSDHGDYLGDHWLGEKELFHDAVSRIPLIVYDPDHAADDTRGKTCDDLVEAIDLAPTFVAAYGGAPIDHILEGRSLLPLLRGGERQPRDVVVSELDYCLRQARLNLGVAPDKARAWMVRSERWKYIHFEGFPPQLFDMHNDPCELIDLGRDAGYAGVVAEHRQRLFEWSLGRRVRITISNDEIRRNTQNWREHGIIIGEW